MQVAQQQTDYLFFLFISDWYGGMHPQPHQCNQDDPHHFTLLQHVGSHDLALHQGTVREVKKKINSPPPKKKLTLETNIQNWHYATSRFEIHLQVLKRNRKIPQDSKVANECSTVNSA